MRGAGPRLKPGAAGARAQSAAEAERSERGSAEQKPGWQPLRLPTLWAPTAAPPTLRVPEDRWMAPWGAR